VQRCKLSNWDPIVVRLEKIGRHPNADTLEISSVMGDTVIFKEGQYREGDLVSYLPYDTICSDHPVFEWLDAKKRIKPMKLRGIFSEGIIVPAPSGFVEGQSVVDYYGLVKYEYPEEVAARIEADTEGQPKHFSIPHYDLENLRKYENRFVDGEQVLITEKIEGENISIIHDGERLWVRSRNLYKKEDPISHWWKTVLEMQLNEKLAMFPGFAFIGELYCGVKYFPYDGPVIDNKVQRKIRIFDIWDTKDRRYVEWNALKEMCSQVGLEIVPELYMGEWKTDKSLYALAEGNSTIGDNLREGFVMRSIPNAFDPYLNGRKIVKLKGTDYQLFKAKKS
jgi:RNA ligase (TIGR02306 family)